MKVVCLWSGGKDSCFACYRAIQGGYKVFSLFNFTESEGMDSLSHGLLARLIQRQVKMTGIPLFQKAMPKETYRRDFKELITRWKEEKGIEGIVFGDIYLQEHKDWIDKICAELEVKAIMPLWGGDTRQLLEEFVRLNFKAIIVTTTAGLLGKEWLGRNLDTSFIEELETMGNIDFCGEKGEFHTFVYDGPLFKKPVEFNIGEKIVKDGRWFLELIPKNGTL